MTTTSTTPPGRRDDQLLERARIAYVKAGGREQPGNASGVHDINGTAVVILRNTNGVLTAYGVHGAALKRMNAGEAAAADLFAQRDAAGAA